MQQALDWDDLRLFLAAARAGSFGGAAAALGVHRSTVLRRIDRLEARLGNRLFERSGSGLALTAAGERLLPQAEKLADGAADILRAADADHGRPAGNIRVAATFNLGFGLLPAPLARFRAAYPEITVELNATADGFSPVPPDDFDLAFRTLEADARGHDDMVGRRLGPLPIAVFGAAAYFAERPAPRDGGDLRHHRVVSLGGGPASIAVTRWLAAHTAGTTPVYRANSMLLLLAAVREGLGVACLPRYLGNGEPGLVHAFDLPAEFGADLWLLRPPHHRDTARMRTFADFMAAEIAALL